jgi:hypothetical protein
LRNSFQMGNKKSHEKNGILIAGCSKEKPVE